MGRLGKSPGIKGGTVGFLRTDNTPEPVTGGVLAGVLFAVFYSATGDAASLELSSRDLLLVVLFRTVGLNARFSSLLAGGFQALFK
jgi:ESS family glutamate:Na+ symporter